MFLRYFFVRNRLIFGFISYFYIVRFCLYSWIGAVVRKTATGRVFTIMSITLKIN